MASHLSNPVAPRGLGFPDGWPRLGLGCAPLGDIFDALGERASGEMLDAAWEAGVRYYDTAPWYGHGLSEHRLGAMLRQHDRADYVVSTKVGRVYDPAPRGEDARERWLGGLNFAVRYDYSAEGFAASLAQSRLRLGEPCIDALIIHDLDGPYHGDAFAGHVEALTTSGLDFLHDLKRSGEIRAVGMGINRIEEFTQFAATVAVDFFLVAMPYTLLDQASLGGPMATCLSRGIGVIVGAPFASGLLTDPSNPRATYNYGPASEAIRNKARAIEAFCQRFDVPLTAAALQFPLFHPAVVAVIPGANTAAHVRANAAAMAHAIPPELWRTLKAEGLLDPDAPTA